MDSKIILAIIAVAIVAVAAVAAVGLGGGSSGPSSDEVRYEGNGGVTVAGNTHMESTMHQVLGQIFNKDGSHIKNWNTKADGSGRTYEIGGTVEFGTTLYAQWSSANSLSAVNMHSGIFHLLVGEKGKSELSVIDDGSAELASSNAVLVVSPAAQGDSITLEDDMTITIVSGSSTYNVRLSIAYHGLSLSYGGVLSEDRGVYLEIEQTGANIDAVLSISVIKHRYGKN